MDERDELRDLAAGLGAHVRRRAAKGARRARGETRKAGPAAPAAQLHRPAAPPAARPAPRPPEPPKVLFPVARTPSATAAPTVDRAAEVRAKARSCADLASLRTLVAGCTACGLCETRTQTVFSDGDTKARVMFIGEGPGENEDLQGVPFVGRAGQLLTDIIEKGMRLQRSQVYIANVVKCRPPENRDPSDLEKATCTPWLDRQIELVDPAVIIPLGRHAANHVLGYSGPRALAMGALRGTVHERNGRKVVPTFHPAYLLRDASQKKECWKDIQLAMGVLGLPLKP